MAASASRSTSAAQPVTSRRAEGWARRARRIAWRVWRTASEVTAQEFSRDTFERLLQANSPLALRFQRQIAVAGIRQLRGALKRISPAIDPASGSFRLVVALDPSAESEESGRLLPGMLVRVEIVVERHPDALVVPKRALRREGDEALVYLVEGGRAARVAVREGFTDDEHVEITPEGRSIEPGARVVVVGNRELEDGAEVAEEAPADEARDPAPVKQG